MLPVQSTQHATVSGNVYQTKQPDTTTFSDVMQGTSATQSLDTIFDKAARTYDIPVSLLKAMAKVESNFNPKAVSGAGAKGVMQLMPATAKSLGVSDAFDPEQNIMGGAKYISQMLDRYDGNTALALAAYNAGSGNVKKYGGIPPFKETQNYVKKVMRYAGENLTAGTYTPSTKPSHDTTVANQTTRQNNVEQSIMNFTDFTEMDYLIFIESLKHRASMSLSDVLNGVTQNNTYQDTEDIFDMAFGKNPLTDLSAGISADTTNLMGNRFQKLYE